MTPVLCRLKTDSHAGTYGDCMRACICSLLHLDPQDVPHFFEDGCDFRTAMVRLREWLRSRKLNIFVTFFDAGCDVAFIFDHMQMENPGQHYLLLSKDHVVICKDSAIVHDPAWYRTALEKPDEVWIVGVLTACL